MKYKNTTITPILEKVSALALIIITLINVLGSVASALRADNVLMFLLNISVSLIGFIFVSIPLIVIAIIVLRGKLRDPESKKPISIAVIVYLAGTLLTGIITSVLYFFSMDPGEFAVKSDGVKKVYYWLIFRTCITNLFLVLAAAAISLIILDALWHKINWKSSLPLMIITYVLLITSLWSYGLLFLIFVSIFLRREDKTHPAVPTACVSGLFSVALMLIKSIVSFIKSIGLIVCYGAFSMAEAYSFNQTFSVIVNVIGLIGFTASLIIPLLHLGRAVSETEEKPAEKVSLAKE